MNILAFVILLQTQYPTVTPANEFARVLGMIVALSNGGWIIRTITKKRK